MAALVVQPMPVEGPYAIGAALEAAGRETWVCRVWAGYVLPSDLSAGWDLVCYEDAQQHFLARAVRVD
ncbi:hypothetical protein ACFWFF_16555 [Streptomyces sp. NPDC060223]|uniref:hypothetical protein n=1 Tax=unclassified Streptomyces TaxID=2593676 RepID=UPI0036342101